MKSQASVTEYLVLVIMIVIIAFLAALLIFGFQFLSAGSEQLKSTERKALFLAESVASSAFLNSPQYPKGSVFEDSKLTAATCGDFEAVWGEGWWAEVRVVKDKGVCESVASWRKNTCLYNLRLEESTACTKQNYPSCNVWSFCTRSGRMVYISIPVNVYRKINNTVELGLLTVGVPSGGG